METTEATKLMMALINGQYIIGRSDGQTMFDPRALIADKTGIKFARFVGDPKAVLIGDYMIAYPVDEQSDIGKAYASEVSGIKIVSQMPPGRIN